MPFDFVEGFDRYAASGSLNFQSRWVASLNSNNVATLVTGRFGARALRLVSNVGGGFIERLATPSLQYGMQCAILVNLNNMHVAPFRIARWKAAGGAIQAAWGINDAGQIQVFDALNAIVFTSAGFEVANGGWTFIEMHVEHSATLGKIVLKVNGEELYNGTGLNTGSLETERIQFSMSATGPVSGSHQYTIDDMATAYDETETPGESAAVIMRPASDVSTQFTRLSGATNADMVDEEQVDGETTYNSSNTVGHTDIFEMTNLATTPDEIKALFISVAARKEDSGTRRLQFFFVIGGVEYPIETVFLGGSYEFYEKVVELNPATGTAWTPTVVNALRIGYRVIE